MGADEVTIVGTVSHQGKPAWVYEWLCTRAMARRGRPRHNAVRKGVLWANSHPGKAPIKLTGWVRGRRRFGECRPRYDWRRATARSWRSP